jgi:hypothetical protein
MRPSPHTRHSGRYNGGAKPTLYPLVKHGLRVRRLVPRHVQVSAVFCCGACGVSEVGPVFVTYSGRKLAELAVWIEEGAAL